MELVLALAQIDGFKLELVKFDPADPCHRSRPVSAATRLSMMAPCAGMVKGKQTGKSPPCDRRRPGIPESRRYVD